MPRRLRYRGHLTLGWRYLALRAMYAAIAVVGAISIVFFMMAATGNPARLMLPEDATEDQVAALSESYGFNDPLLIRYVKFLGQTLTGTFPDSIRYGQPALELVLSRVPATLQLSGTAMALGVAVGLLLGYWLAASRHSGLSSFVLRLLVLLQAVPAFLMALILILIFSLTLHWLPTSGFTSWASLVLPVTVFTIFIVPGVARIFRSTLVGTYKSDHVLTAIAKGSMPRVVRIRHVAVNSLGPVLTYIGLQVGGILGGAVVIESVFAYPGVGQLLTNSVNARDFPVTLAVVTLVAVGYVITSFLVDVALVALDPRSKMGD